MQKLGDRVHLEAGTPVNAVKRGSHEVWAQGVAPYTGWFIVSVRDDAMKFTPVRTLVELEGD